MQRELGNTGERKIISPEKRMGTPYAKFHVAKLLLLDPFQIFTIERHCHADDITAENSEIGSQMAKI